MISKIKNKLTKISEKKKLLGILSAFALFFLFFIDKFWISPDEYFYVSLGRTLSAAFHGAECFNCIDTAHTPLLSFFISLGYYFFDVDSIMLYRIIPIAFGVATLYIFYKIAKIAYEKNEALFSFALVLLFPGFISFSNKVYLDIMVLFFISLVVYLLLKREKYWKIGLALVFVFLSKEYAVFFPGGVVFFLIILDALKKENIPFFQKIKDIFVNIFVAFAPLTAIAALFLATSILPYPRMLENLIVEVFGPAYWHMAALFHRGVPEETLIGGVKDAVGSMIQRNIVSVVRGASIWEKMKDIYLSSYQDGDVNILAVPLIIVGLAVRMRSIYFLFRKNYNSIRKDLILIIFLIIVLYFNFRVSSGDHGFRIIFPLLIPFVYFIYWAFKEMLEKNNYWPKFFFGILSFLFILFYFQTNKTGIVYHSVISSNGIVATFLEYKVYANVIIYGFFAGLILIYFKLQIRWKALLLIMTLIFMYLYKVAPFAVDKYYANKKYGVDYNLMLARPYLSEIEGENPIVLTNAKSYAYYYYANSTKMPNDNTRKGLPVIRKKPKTIYPNRLIYSKALNENMNVAFLCQEKVDYVFYVHTNGNDIFPNGVISTQPFLTAVVEYELPQTGRFNWGLYKTDKNFCK